MVKYTITPTRCTDSKLKIAVALPTIYVWGIMQRTVTLTSCEKNRIYALRAASLT